jgi:uncharacterized protein YndB with AHSA1/START domain
MRIEHEATASATPAAVYEWIAEPRRRPRWLQELRVVDAPPGEVTKGEVFSGRSRAFGHEMSGLSHIVDLHENVSLTEHVVVGVGLRSTWTLAEDGGGTRVHHRLDIDAPGGFLAPLEKLVLRWWLGRMQRRSLAALGRVAVGEPSGK